jgi:hypothetical protein
MPVGASGMGDAALRVAVRARRMVLRRITADGRVSK